METNQTTVTNKKMMACKTCGTQMAKSAKKCPSCGAKNKKPPVFLIIVLALVIVLGGLFALRVYNYNSSDAILTVNGTEYNWNEYRDLYHEYYLNGKTIEFKENFVPVSVEKSGEITQISDAIIGSTMNGNMPTRNTLKKFEITIDDGCTYSVIYKYYDEADYDFSHLSVGDKVTVRGFITEEDLFPTNKIEDYLASGLKITGTAENIVKEVK